MLCFRPTFVHRRMAIAHRFVLGVFLMAAALPLAAYDQQLRAVADTLSPRLTASGKKNVAVIDFTDLPGNTTELGRFLAEELSVDMAMVAKGFRVIDRTHLKAILQENKLATTGVIDPLTARKLGQIAGIDALITGTVTPFGDSVRLTVKVLDTATAEMLTAANTDIPKTKAVEELLARGIGGTPTSQPTGVQASSGSGAPSRPAAAPGAMQQSGAGYTITLQSCRKSGTSVDCIFSAVKPDSDGSLRFDSSHAFDDTGLEHQAQRFSFAGKDHNYYGNTVAGLPVRFSVGFDGVSTASGVLPLVEVGGLVGTQTLKLQFRNVPVQ